MADIKDPVNWAIEEMRRMFPKFTIAKFIRDTGVSRKVLDYHKADPDAKWTKPYYRYEMAAFFKEHFEGRIIADHVACKMIRVEDKTNE